MKPLTQRQKQLIASNVIAACRDIEKLNKTGYNFLYQCSGFIAHYNLNGFIAYYSTHSLQADIEANAKFNQWGNFKPHDRDYAYYMEKRDCYNMILGRLVAREALNEQFDHAMQFLRDHLIVVHVK
jgi:hypothetical protein